MLDKLIKMAEWAQANWLALVIVLTLLWGSFLGTVAFSWLYGYWSNGLYGTKFDLGSCWQGIAAILAGFASVLGLAKAGWTKWRTDSEFNTLQGIAPGQKETGGGKGG